MRRSLATALACILLLCTACSGPAEEIPSPSSPPGESAVESPGSDSPPSEAPALPELSQEVPAPAPPDPKEEAFQARLEEIIAIADGPSSPEEVVLAYLELQYLGYSALRSIDLGLVLDTSEGNMYNLDMWQEHLIQRRRLLEDSGLCYVDQEQYPYDVTFLAPEELRDERMDFWGDYDFGDSADVELHFVVSGEPGKGYPPLMAVNAQHTVRLRPEGEGWRITFHYFPGAVRKYYRTGILQPRDDDAVLQELNAEFAQYSDNTTLSPRSGSRPYHGLYAARYARAFAETPNENFYHVGDWNGNCMNFVSQCVLHGFGQGLIPDDTLSSLMTAEWFSGGGGGTTAWENVDYFWDYAVSGGAMRCQVLQGPASLRMGDLVQTRNSYVGENDDPKDFSHCLIVVDPDTLLLAQNTPANFVYYSDLVNTNRRFLRPVYLDS